ncbi:ABC transporter family substrate-binding protein [Arthrobacter sp. RIT-PI-e]|uniref:ABC transporter family substrate-binding protein n=1 Tax=Arthrobacter sp. RIT-PI-e TaxID=1681197 RepID=UPI000675FFCF|nr:ABC transporter family substrate-binding protein [Arthrobacter sp. RIT-PI-e]
MRNKRTISLAALSIGALMLSACGSAGGTANDSPSEDAGENLATTINIAISQAPSGYNGNTSSTNSVYNTYIDNLTSSGFAAFAANGNLEPNEDFGSYEKISDDPLTIRYTINDDAVWSDGVPIDYDDVLLTWAAMSGTHPIEDDADLFQASSTNGFASMEMIEGEPGDKEFEAVFTEPYADWEALFTTGTFLPAHIAAEQGGLSTDDNGAALVDAIKNDDRDALTPVAEFWNSGWNYQVDLPSLPDTALLPTSGPYSYVNAVNGTLTLQKNEQYWGEDRAGQTDTIVFKTIVDEESVQALQNGDVDIIEPSSPTVDTKAALEQIGETVTVDTGQSLTFSHVDLDQRPGAVFEDLRVRQAFAACMPRADMVDKFVTPVDPEGTVMNLHEYQPAQEDYQTVLDGAPAAQGDGVADIERARELLEEAGKTEPVRVSMMHASTSQLRADQVALVKDSCDQAGFEIMPQPEAEWSAKLSQPGSWDAVVFGWAGSGLVASGQSIYISTGEQNYGGYTDSEVDSLWDEIVTTTDAEQVIPLKTDLEQRLAETQYNVVLYANPNIAGYSSKLEGVELNPTQTGITWNAYSWTKQN